MQFRTKYFTEFLVFVSLPYSRNTFCSRKSHICTHGKRNMLRADFLWVNPKRQAVSIVVSSPPKMENAYPNSTQYFKSHVKMWIYGLPTVATDAALFVNIFYFVSRSAYLRNVVLNMRDSRRIRFEHKLCMELLNYFMKSTIAG